MSIKPTVSSFFSPNNCTMESSNVLKDKTLNKIVSTLNQYRKEGKMCDFELRILAKVFPVHKLVLSAASPYFEAMFKSCFIENLNNYMEIKEIENVEIIETILNYIYTGEIEITSQNVFELIQVSSIFQLVDLMNFCIKFLECSLHTHNCIGILRFADFYGLSHLCFVTKRYIENNFAEILKEEEFLELPANLYKPFLKCENLSIFSEHQVLAGTIDWVLHNVDERLTYLNDFLEIIRMPIIPKDQIEAILRKTNNTNVIEILKRYMKLDISHYADQINTGYNSVRCKPRMALRRSIYVFGGQTLGNNPRWNSLQTLFLVEKFNFHTGTWHVVKSLMYPRSSHCVVHLNNKLFIIGGQCDSLILETMEIFDPVTDESILGSNLVIPRSSFGACTHNSQIYVFGGEGDGSMYIEQYDPVRNVWQIHDQMPSYRYGMQVVEHEGKCYIIGGVITDEIITNSVISYDPVEKKFFELAPLNTARKSFAATIMHERIWVIGGLGQNNQLLSSVEQYNINKNTWSYVTNLPSAKSNLCAVSINNMVYVYGGYTQSFRMGKQVYVYDPELNQWLTSKPMTQCRKDAAVIVV